MRFRSGRAVAAGAAAAIAVTGVAVAASPPISSSGRHAQRAARVDLKDPTRKAIPQTSQAQPGGSLDNAGASATARLARALRPGHREPADRRPAGRGPPRRLPHRPLERERHVDRARLRARPRHGVRADPAGPRRAQARARLHLVAGRRAAPPVGAGRRRHHRRRLQRAGQRRERRPPRQRAGRRARRRRSTGARPTVSADGAYAAHAALGRLDAPRCRSSARRARPGTRTTDLRRQRRARSSSPTTPAPGCASPGARSRPSSADGTYDSLVDAADGPHRAARQPRQVRRRARVRRRTRATTPAARRRASRSASGWPPARITSRARTRTRSPTSATRSARMLTEDGFERSLHAAVRTARSAPSAGSDWLYPIQNVPDAAGDCPADAPGCTWNHTVPDSWQLNRNRRRRSSSTSSTSSTTTCSAAPIGFDAASGNFSSAGPDRTGVRAGRRRRRHAPPGLPDDDPSGQRELRHAAGRHLRA